MAQNQLTDIRSLDKELNIELITDIQTTVEKTIEKYMISMEEEVSDLRLKNDEFEQYTRRYSLRISCIPETEGENPDDVVLNVSKIMNVDIALSDIDRAHRVGKRSTSKDRDRQLIVRFTSYRARRSFYKGRLGLKHAPKKDRGIYVNADLTKYKLSLLKKPLKLKRETSIINFWTIDGKLFVTTAKGGEKKPFLIRSEQDLEQIMKTKLTFYEMVSDG